MRICLVFAICTLFVTQQASSHARFELNGTLKPRNASTGLKTAPCGGIARTANIVTLTKGQTFTVTWEETINHPGRYEFYYSTANDAGFKLLKTIQDVQDAGAVPHKYSTTLKIDEVCDACTLQLIQVMTDTNPATNYYSCSDIKVKAAAVAPPPVEEDPPPEEDDGGTKKRDSCTPP